MSDRQGFLESVIRQPIIQDNTDNMGAQGRLAINPPSADLFILTQAKNCPAPLLSITFAPLAFGN